MYVNLIGVVNMEKLILAVLVSMVFIGNANALQPFYYLVGSVTSYNNIAPTDGKKFSSTTTYGPIYFSTLANCSAVQTAIEGHRAIVIPSNQKDNVIGSDNGKLLMVSTLQCLPITQ